MVGIQKYVYDVFGPAVNLAQKLRERAEPMEIVSAAISASGAYPDKVAPSEPAVADRV